MTLLRLLPSTLDSVNIENILTGYGESPDVVTADGRLIEIKCPFTSEKKKHDSRLLFLEPPGNQNDKILKKTTDL